jgi:phosphate uptake regulator
MYRRKIQLIAGTTYSISLPKEWVKNNNLKEKQEVNISEKNDRTLVISPSTIKQKNLKDITLDVDNYISNIGQIVFALYYLGIENINLFSKKGLSKDIKSRIRKTLTHMSGTEISYEDSRKISIKVLLDKSKIDIHQVLYRISLILEMSISNILENNDIDEIRINENEIDRLYHLIAKIVSLSLVDSNILNTSKIKNISLVPSYFLISKRLENLGDDINHLAIYLEHNRGDFRYKKAILEFIRQELKKAIKHILSDSNIVFGKIDSNEIKKIKDKMKLIDDKAIFDFLDDSLRKVIDINEEIVNISFYQNLINDGLL